MALPEHIREAPEPGLRRGLKARHITMISLGGTIGTGLFLSSGSSIATAGPGGALVAYSAMAFIIYLVMASLGEMATYMPVTGSFGTYASRFVDPAFGFALGWNYWYAWSNGVAVELVAAGLIMEYWFPSVNSLMWSSACLLLLIVLNMISVRSYGEVEYWLSLVKVVTIIIFIFVATLVVGGVIGNRTYGFKNWKESPFHTGFSGLFAVVITAAFSFLGVELVGITAGESKNPRRDVPKAVSQVFWRVTLFYILSIFMIGLIIPYDDENLVKTKQGVSVSPFTLIFTKMGVKNAASVMNAVVLITVLSAGNSGLYASSRVMYTLSTEGKAPAFLSKVSKHGVPYFALLASASVSMITFLTSIINQGSVYTWLLSLSATSGFIAWFGISVSHLRFRKAYLAQGRYLEDLPYVAKMYPFGPWVSICVLATVALSRGYTNFGPNGVAVADLVAAYIGLVIFIVMYVIYKLVMRTKVVAITEMDLDTGRQVYLVEHERELMKREQEEQRMRAGTLWQRFKQSSFVKALDWI